MVYPSWNILTSIKTIAPIPETAAAVVKSCGLNSTEFSNIAQFFIGIHETVTNSATATRVQFSPIKVIPPQPSENAARPAIRGRTLLFWTDGRSSRYRRKPVFVIVQSPQRTRNLLDTTLVVVATEFGRPPEFDGGGGRGHQSRAFSVPMFGGGLNSGLVVGVTDDPGANVVENPVTVPDLHATIDTAMGIDPSRELYDGDRPVPITDHGKPLIELFQ